MRRSTLSRGGRLALAGASALLLAAITAITAAAGTVVYLAEQNVQTVPTPVQLVQGDLIDVSLAPVTAVPAGAVMLGDGRAPLPTSSDSQVLPRITAEYDADGTAHAMFRAASSGTATLVITGPSASFRGTGPCPTPTPSPSGGSTTSSTSTTSATSTTSTLTTSTTSTTSTSISSSTSTTTQCQWGIATVLSKTVAVNVSAAAVQGASVSVPATGASASQLPSAALIAAGALVATLAFAVRRVRRGRL